MFTGIIEETGTVRAVTANSLCISAEKVLEGTVDLFAWNNNGLAKAGLIEAAMEEAGVAWRVNLAANYEENTGYTHWEWIFNCLG